MTKYPTPLPKDERLHVVVPSHLKQRVFEEAARREVSVSQLVRQAIAAATQTAKAA